MIALWDNPPALPVGRPLADMALYNKKVKIPNSTICAIFLNKKSSLKSVFRLGIDDNINIKMHHIITGSQYI